MLNSIFSIVDKCFPWEVVWCRSDQNYTPWSVHSSNCNIYSFYLYTPTNLCTSRSKWYSTCKYSITIYQPHLYHSSGSFGPEYTFVWPLWGISNPFCSPSQHLRTQSTSLAHREIHIWIIQYIASDFVIPVNTYPI